MIKHIFNLLLLVFISSSLFAQEYIVSGNVSDSSTNEKLFGASIYIVELNKGASTNESGLFKFRLKEGVYTFKLSYIGYKDKIQKITVDKGLNINFRLQSSSESLQELIVEGQASDKNVDNTDIGKIELGIEEIKAVPQFMGEVDVLKTIQLMPGVQSGGEGNAGFSVRGGGPDQNLMLLDNVPIYNASHLFGFFSVFNADAIQNVSITKGGIPANYGGKLASVIDIEQKDGDFEKYHVEGGIGVISSRIAVNGPIAKNKASFMFSARRTYVDVLMKPFIKKDATAYGSGYYFYDLNGKITWRASKKDVISLMGYFGKDKFNYNNNESGFSVEIPWGNGAAGLKWVHTFSPKLFLTNDIIFSDYQFDFKGGQEDFDFSLYSAVRDIGSRTQLKFIPNNKMNMRFGVDYTYHTFTPSSVTARSGETEFNTGDRFSLYAHEVGVYADNDHELTKHLKIRYGVRYSYFQHTGPFNRYIKDASGVIYDTTKYGDFENIADYHAVEPRVSFRIKFNKSTSIKGGFTYNYQPVHLTSLSSVSLPTDTWVPSTELVKPQTGQQYNLGFFKNFKDNMFETSFEVYYKNMNNLVEYADGAGPDDGVNDNFDDYLVFGKGYSVGGEVFLKKSIGKFTGWVGYTLSWTNRTFPDLNEGNEFPAKYDRRHDLSIVASYKFNERWTLSSAFVYTSGNTMTVPVSRYFIEGRMVNQYGDRNAYRLPAYHRLDFSATYNFKDVKKKTDKKTGETKFVKRKLKQSLVISVYNSYSRANPFFIYFDNEGNIENNDFRVVAKQVSIFPILPSITWNFKF